MTKRRKTEENSSNSVWVSVSTITLTDVDKGVRL